ncbi:tropomodulin-like [Watersipora subatra]|uniref:tropomodulin-like n=1 Tax=Watersipora subatra TaxID=2589382 RepID=UPI00355B7840
MTTTMDAPWTKKQEVSAFDDFDIDELLAQLTPEEIEQLESEADPDNTLLPPSERCKNQTSKADTGPLDREKLLKWLEDKAKAEKDWEEAKPYTKEKRGRAWVPKEDQTNLNDFDTESASELKTDFDDILNQASEEELVDLAAVLGFHAMLNQDQYNASLTDKPVHGGFKGVAKATLPAMTEPVAPNTTDVEKCIERLSSDDSTLTEVNLNNIKTVSPEKFERLFRAVSSNSHIAMLAVASTNITDPVAKDLAAALKKNRSLKTVIADSNFIRRDMVVELVRVASESESIREISLENQKPSMLGVKAEQELAKIVEASSTLEKLGVHFESLNARIRVQDKLQKNYDKHRKQRVEK